MISSMRDDLLSEVQQCLFAIEQLRSEKALLFMEEASDLIAACYRSGNKLLLAGNGGSLCDAAHFAEELTGYFRKKRPALPALALADPGHITCVANDAGFETVFSRGVEAFGKEGDLFIGLTTSGNSPNLVRAFEAAAQRGLKTIAFLGRGGGLLREVADLELIIEGPSSDRIQEAHMAAAHLIISLVEKKFLYTKAER